MTTPPTVEYGALEQELAREPGSSPGLLHHEERRESPVLSAIGYDADDYRETRLEELSELTEIHQHWEKVWLNVDGIWDAELLREVGERFGLSPLILEDIQNVPQRPGVQELDERLFLVTLMPHAEDDPVTIEQVSIVLGEDHVLTFQERPGGDVLDPVRDRLRRGAGTMRSRGSDYLAYAIVDTIVDAYQPLLEDYNQHLTGLEGEIVERPAKAQVEALYAYKRSASVLERVTRPQLDAVQRLARLKSPLIDETTQPYLLDCADHASRTHDLANYVIGRAGSLMDLYLSTASHRMNDVMRVLTITATIFIPLTFIAGIYGMNFDSAVSAWNMPELKWAYGYPAALLVMALIAVGMLVFFARKGWLGEA